MNGTIFEIINGGSIYLLLVDTGGQVAEVPVEYRAMINMIEGEGLHDPQELLGRTVEVGEDGLFFTDEATETEASSPANLIAAEWKGQTHFGY